MALQGFDQSYYLSAKLTALQATYPEWATKTTTDLNTFLANAGYTPESHYEAWGWQEGLAPNAYFNPSQYTLAKATSLFNAGLYVSIDAAKAAFQAAWTADPYQHYLAYGDAENVNPSNSFDVSSYYASKLAALQADPATSPEWAGKTVADLQAYFKAAGLTALGHYEMYGQAEGIPVTVVPDDEKVDDTPAGTPGDTFTLTTGVDAITGTANDDTINGTITASATTTTLNAFDSINGGNGTDTLNISASAAANFALPSSVTISNVEKINIAQAASGGTGTGALTVTDTSIATGIKNFSYTDASAAVDMTAAAIAITLNSATDVTAKATGTGTFTTVAVTDKSTTAADTGSILNNITIQKASGAATLTGNAINTVNLNAVAGLTTVTAAAATRALTINASGTTAQGGLTDAQATSATLNVTGAQNFGTLTVAKAADVTVKADAATTAAVVAATAKTMTVDGTGLLTLTAGGGNAALQAVTVKGSGGVAVDLSAIATLTSVDTSASTAVAPASGVKTGANTITIGTGVAYTGGAGEDVVTVGATTKAIALGGGNDIANLSVTALGTGGSIAGGDGTDVLKLSNADAVTLSTAGAVQTAFKAAVTGFETLDITTQSASTIDVSGMGTFTQINMVSATAAQVLNGVATGNTIQSTYGAAGTSITTNALTGASDTINFIMKGDLSGGARVFGALATPGVETVNLTTNDTATAFAAQLATLTLTDAAATTIKVAGNNGLALTHTGTALHTLDASGITKGAVTFTSAALTTDATVLGSATGNDTLNFAASLGKVTITETAGTNTLTGSSTAANTITGGSGIDTITGGSAVDTISVGTGSTANSVTGAAGADSIDLTGSAGVDTVIYGIANTAVGATGANVDTITNFVTGVDKVQLTAGDNSATASTITAGGLAGINLAAGSTLAAFGSTVTNATSVATISDVYTALTTDLAAATGRLAASATGAGNIHAAKVVFSTGDAAGTYLVINDVTAGFQAATDMVIKLAGTTDFGVADLTVV
ncbi:beta strand repeat-containing protein [Desulfopila aestuarii]|uniref:S-layer protein n=1 Tax=Desulfopila aestuarii DSM 18488 TaxID=1121416 RepID=A0A1M7YIA8_9BACT|nr:bluetail domain-containing putative surface protein [Desulfopila aestuarii]SHO52258.1 S-layer protein [Desulfopila aestuarii DSM 18488]